MVPVATDAYLTKGGDLMIFSISEDLDKAIKITEGSFAGLNIWERQHIEKWVSTNPEMLGEDLLVVSIEFDRFTSSDDRLDVLALDRTGNLVVIEIKRDSAAGYSDLQAIRYAAMVSTMTIEVLIPYYIGYRMKYCGESLSDNEALAQVIEFVQAEKFTEISNKPRIILCSEGFSREITATVLWLRDFKIDISCVKVTPYKIDEKIVIVPKVVIPLEETKQYLIEIKRKEEIKEESERTRNRPTINVLIENNLVQAGDEILFKNALPSHVQYEEGNPKFSAEITGKLGQSDAVKWNFDGREYSISALARKIFKEYHPERKDPISANGPLHWVNSAETPLVELATEFRKKSA